MIVATPGGRAVPGATAAAVFCAGVAGGRFSGPMLDCAALDAQGVCWYVVLPCASVHL
jgi:hypothetical protein